MEIFFVLIVIIFSIVIHEVAHGSVADLEGDPTARYAGRLTLNPIKHIDPVGSILVPLFCVIFPSRFIFGWAKPVPINPYNFKDQKYGELKVALAGPSANLIIALFFGLLIRFFPELIPGGIFIFSYIVFINILLAIFNLLPIPPLDGSHIFFTFFPRLENKIKTLYSGGGFLMFPLLFLFIFVLFPFVLNIVFIFFELITGAKMSF
jgi:Zn-dependent protease